MVVYLPIGRVDWGGYIPGVVVEALLRGTVILSSWFRCDLHDVNSVSAGQESCLEY